MPRLVGLPLRGAAYQPRHRSARWDKADQRILAELSPVGGRSLANEEFLADESWLSSDCEDSDFREQLTRGQIRRMLERSAISDDLTETSPELVYLVAHSSHTSATLASAWTEFQQATRDAYALRVGRRPWWEFFRPQDLGSSSPQVEAAEIKLSLADDAWCLITNGEPWPATELAGGPTVTP